MPGTKNLDNSEAVRKAVLKCADQDGWVCAICAAPSVLGHLGLLKGYHATCFPGFETELTGAKVVTNCAVCKDRKRITANGPGAAIDFALTLVEALCGKKLAEEIRSGMQCN